MKDSTKHCKAYACEVYSLRLITTRQATQLICLGYTITQYYSTLLRYNYKLYNTILHRLQILSYYVTIMNYTLYYI